MRPTRLYPPRSIRLARPGLCQPRLEKPEPRFAATRIHRICPSATHAVVAENRATPYVSMSDLPPQGLGLGTIRRVFTAIPVARRSEVLELPHGLRARAKSFVYESWESCPLSGDPHRADIGSVATGLAPSVESRTGVESRKGVVMRKHSVERAFSLNALFRAGVFLLRKTCPLERRHCPEKGRSRIPRPYISLFSCVEFSACTDRAGRYSQTVFASPSRICELLAAVMSVKRRWDYDFPAPPLRHLMAPRGCGDVPSRGVAHGFLSGREAELTTAFAAETLPAPDPCRSISFHSISNSFSPYRRAPPRPGLCFR